MNTPRPLEDWERIALSANDDPLPVYPSVPVTPPLASEIAGNLQNLLARMKAAKPDDRSEKTRHWAIAITEFEKVVAYFGWWVVGK